MPKIGTLVFRPVRRPTGRDAEPTEIRPFGIAQGVHPKAIQELLRHSSIQITMDTYGLWSAKKDPSLRSLPREPIFMMQATEYGFLYNPVPGISYATDDSVVRPCVNSRKMEPDMDMNDSFTRYATLRDC